MNLGGYAVRQEARTLPTLSHFHAHPPAAVVITAATAEVFLAPASVAVLAAPPPPPPRAMSSLLKFTKVTRVDNPAVGTWRILPARLNPRLLSKLASYDVASSIRQGHWPPRHLTRFEPSCVELHDRL